MKRTGNKGRSPARKPAPQDFERQIVQIIPADPGWHALYDEDGELATMPLVCFGLVEVREGGEAPMRFVCPMVVHADGVIEDVHYTDGFVDLIPPCMHGSAHSHDEAGHPGHVEHALGEVAS